jgi:hypothetical protein
VWRAGLVKRPVMPLPGTGNFAAEKSGFSNVKNNVGKYRLYILFFQAYSSLNVL